jgi:hypothetical protein
MSPPHSPKRSRRPILLGALIGIAVLQILSVAWLARSQVQAARERQALEAAARAKATRCFEQAIHRGRDACRSETLKAAR